jgi:hypothetical protein
MREIEISPTLADGCRHQRTISPVAFTILSFSSLNSQLSRDATCAYIRNLPDPGPIICELKYLPNALIRSARQWSARRLQEVLAQTDEFQYWFEGH